jgi:uncharacterized MAPEG superfamily protein
MTTELWILFAAACLGIVHISAASFAFKAQVGNRYTVGPRDEDLRPSGLAGRLSRAQTNFMETFPVFAVFVVIIVLSDASGPLGLWGSAVYLAGRIVYLPLYAAGIPWLRTFCWNIATLGLVLTGAQVLL